MCEDECPCFNSELLSRRRFLKILAAGGSSTLVFPHKVFASSAVLSHIAKEIPKTRELLPSIGLGTWIAFNVGKSARLREGRTAVLTEFFRQGGAMIDSSPMYGSAEDVVGDALEKLNGPPTLFSATKVWTSSTSEGVKQIKKSMQLWRLKKIDLYQVHNLVNWEAHLETLFDLKREGKIRYVGVTTSHGRRHRELEQVMLEQPLDFVQLTYNLLDREVEKRLLPLAREKKIAVIANRPFQGGALIRSLKSHPFPKWGTEVSASNWSEFALKFITSHPAITCAIPATSRSEHMRENMGAGVGTLPDKEDRKRMLSHVLSL